MVLGSLRIELTSWLYLLVLDWNGLSIDHCNIYKLLLLFLMLLLVHLLTAHLWCNKKRNILLFSADLNFHLVFLVILLVQPAICPSELHESIAECHAQGTQEIVQKQHIERKAVHVQPSKCQTSQILWNLRCQARKFGVQTWRVFE